MAFSSSNLRKILDFGITSAGSLWAHQSTDVHAVVESASYFQGAGFGSPSSNAVGMRVGDLLANINVSTAGTSAITWHRVVSLTTSTGFGSPISCTVSPDST